MGRPNTTRSLAYWLARSMKNFASPMHSDAIRIRSAFMPSRMYLKPFPSSPTRFSAGTSRSSNSSSVVAWLSMVRTGVMVRPAPLASRMSTSSTLIPAEVLASSRGEVRQSSTIRSECSARLIHSLRPFTTYLSPTFFAKVVMRVVSVPESGSVTPKACSRSSPVAILGR